MQRTHSSKVLNSSTGSFMSTITPPPGGYYSQAVPQSLPAFPHIHPVSGSFLHYPVSASQPLIPTTRKHCRSKRGSEASSMSMKHDTSRHGRLRRSASMNMSGSLNPDEAQHHVNAMMQASIMQNNMLLSQMMGHRGGQLVPVQATVGTPGKMPVGTGTGYKFAKAHSTGGRGPVSFGKSKSSLISSSSMHEKQSASSRRAFVEGPRSGSCTPAQIANRPALNRSLSYKNSPSHVAALRKLADLEKKLLEICASQERLAAGMMMLKGRIADKDAVIHELRQKVDNKDEDVNNGDEISHSHSAEENNGFSEELSRLQIQILDVQRCVKDAMTCSLNFDSSFAAVEGEKEAAAAVVAEGSAADVDQELNLKQISEEDIRPSSASQLDEQVSLGVKTVESGPDSCTITDKEMSSDDVIPTESPSTAGDNKGSDKDVRKKRFKFSFFKKSKK